MLWGVGGLKATPPPRMWGPNGCLPGSLETQHSPPWSRGACCLGQKAGTGGWAPWGGIKRGGHGGLLLSLQTSPHQYCSPVAPPLASSQLLEPQGPARLLMARVSLLPPLRRAIAQCSRVGPWTQAASTPGGAGPLAPQGSAADRSQVPLFPLGMFPRNTWPGSFGWSSEGRGAGVPSSVSVGAATSD